MRKSIGITLFAGLFFLAGSTLFAADLSSAAGCWKTKDDKTGQIKSIVKLYVSNGTLYGKIVKLTKDPDSKCTKCRGYRKDKPIQGMVFIWGVKELGEKSGYILDPANGKTYKVKIFRSGNTLKVRGYIAFFYRTQTWYKSGCQ